MSKKEDIDVGELKVRAESRRVPVNSSSDTSGTGWICNFCKKKFKSEVMYMKHSCPEMMRHDALSKPEGQAAYQFYCDWMRLHKKSIPNMDTFATSRYCTSFLKFAKHIKKINLSNPDTFVKLMIERDISPMLWTRSQCYDIYLAYYDNMQNPTLQVADSIDVLVKLAEKEEVELSKIFEHLGSNRITELVVQRKLTPWLLFCSRTFGNFLRSLPASEWTVMQDAINPGYWAEKLEDNKDLVAEIIEISNDVGL